MITIEAIESAVAAEFKRKPRSFYRRTALAGRADNARSIFMYLLVTKLPVPERFNGRYGTTRARSAHDGNAHRVARHMKITREAVRHHLHRVEDLRDDPAFDERLSKLEQTLTAPD